jgi:hypothetical protein
MKNKYSNKVIPAIIISTGKTVNLCDFINMVLEFEEKIQDKRKKFYSIMGNGKRLRDLMIDCENEKLMFPDIEKLYKSLKKEVSCGAFCHR